MNSRLVQTFILLVSAAVTVSGVVFFGWEIMILLLLYWLENVIIGVVQVVKILSARLEGDGTSKLKRLGLCAFFCLHYGGFCGIHGLFILLFSSISQGDATGGPVAKVMIDAFEPFGPWVFLTILWGVLVQVAILLPPGAWLAVAGMAIGKALDLSRDFFLNGAWRTASPRKLMGEPYKHIIVIHLAIIFGAILAITFQNAIAILLIIVIGKLLIDLRDLYSVKRSLTDQGNK